MCLRGHYKRFRCRYINGKKFFKKEWHKPEWESVKWKQSIQRDLSDKWILHPSNTRNRWEGHAHSYTHAYTHSIGMALMRLLLMLIWHSPAYAMFLGWPYGVPGWTGLYTGFMLEDSLPLLQGEQIERETERQSEIQTYGEKKVMAFNNYSLRICISSEVSILEVFHSQLKDIWHLKN